MSDETDKPYKNPDWTDLLGGMGGSMGSIWGLMAGISGAIDNLDRPRTKRAFELVPGDIIRVGPTHVYVVGAMLRDVGEHGSTEAHQTIQLAGAEALWMEHDWRWFSNKVMYDSPLLRFHPLQVLEVSRESDMPTLKDRILEFAVAVKQEKAEEATKAAEKRELEKEKKREEVERLRAEWEAEKAAESDEPSADSGEVSA